MVVLRIKFVTGWCGFVAATLMSPENITTTPEMNAITASQRNTLMHFILTPPMYQFHHAA
jgi:hypothetical protein